MEITIKRFEFATNYTIGKLYVDGNEICYTLEDTVREQDGVAVDKWKIKGFTAIPKGTYKVLYSYSNRFDKNLPELLDVPGFSGIRIHTGNSSSNTEGCILVGSQWAGTDWISGSKQAYDKLMSYLKPAFTTKTPVQITIT